MASAGYLGLQHASRELSQWDRLTTGRPAALAPPPGADELARQLARLLGCEGATLGPSTLHLFWDLFGLLSDEAVAIYLDSGSYAISRWGVERALARGTPVRTFPHHSAEALSHQLAEDTPHRLRPVVVTDGFCPSCGEPAPLAAYLEVVRPFGGQLILDDTQALGILGHAPGPDEPYGRGGGGSLRWENVEGPDVLVVSSLAKAFGVPVAVLAGSGALVRWFAARSETRAHCSPPSAAHLRAVEHALAVNENSGDALRLHLAERVRQLRGLLEGAGFSVHGGMFPVQTLEPVPGLDSFTLQERLLRLGVRTAPGQSHTGQEAKISFIVTALHSPDDIERAVNALVRAVGTASGQFG
jgi:8-amino-7-oxononanoate synthase